MYEVTNIIGSVHQLLPEKQFVFDMCL